MAINQDTVSARPATEADGPFLREVFFEIRSPEFELARSSQLRDLLAHQFQSRAGHFAELFPGAQYGVLTRDGLDVGYELIAHEAETRLIDIAVLPRFQNQGIGAARLASLLEEAGRLAKPVVLSVEIFNPARRLFLRLGFEEIEDSGIYKRMRWAPPVHSAQPR